MAADPHDEPLLPATRLGRVLWVAALITSPLAAVAIGVLTWGAPV